MLKSKFFDVRGMLEVIIKNFPNSVEGGKLTREIVHNLATEYGATLKNTLFGFSTCPDEINRTVTQFNRHYGGKEFPLGGLTGYPFRGKTGFDAFSHHAPNDDGKGNLVILYGPHVGVNYNGELGKIVREGQLHESTACGAAIGFLSKYKEARLGGKYYVPKEDFLDREQYVIEKLMIPYAETILVAENQIKELVDVNYRIIEDDILKIIGNLTKHFSGSVFLIGGVMINTPPLQPSYFDIRRFERYYEGVEDLKEKFGV